MKYESGIKGTWNIVKEVISQRKVRSSLLIAEMFNNSLTDSNPKLALTIPPLNNLYLQYIIAALFLLKNSH